MSIRPGNIEGPGGVNNAAIEYIVNYVMNTPNNTNPNVLRSILTSIFEEMASVSNNVNSEDAGDITIPDGDEADIVKPGGPSNSGSNSQL